VEIGAFRQAFTPLPIEYEGHTSLASQHEFCVPTLFLEASNTVFAEKAAIQIEIFKLILFCVVKSRRLRWA
jgi:hypothetical protein